jgi:hypothetical protein
MGMTKDELIAEQMRAYFDGDFMEHGDMKAAFLHVWDEAFKAGQAASIETQDIDAAIRDYCRNLTQSLMNHYHLSNGDVLHAALLHGLRTFAAHAGTKPTNKN